MSETTARPWHVAMNGERIDIHARVVPAGEAPRELTVAADVRTLADAHLICSVVNAYHCPEGAAQAPQPMEVEQRTFWGCGCPQLSGGVRERLCPRHFSGPEAVELLGNIVEFIENFVPMENRRGEPIDYASDWSDYRYDAHRLIAKARGDA